MLFSVAPRVSHCALRPPVFEHFWTFPRAYTSAGQETDWTITYVPGWFASTGVVSPDVKAEVIRAVSALREQPAPGVSSVSVGDLSVAYGGAPDAQMSPAIDAATMALYAYRGVLL